MYTRFFERRFDLFRVALNVADNGLDLNGRLFRLLSELSHFGRNDGKPFSVLTRTRCFNRRV